MKEFAISDAVEAIKFKIGDDVFVTVPPNKLPGNVLIRYAEQIQAGKLYEATMTFFNRALETESAIQFNHRLDSKENPITLEIMMEVVEWLVEQFSNLGMKGASA